MTRVAALVLVVGLASCTTKRHAAIGTAAGAGMFAAGIVMLEAGENGPSLTRTQTAGVFIGSGGLVIGATSLIALIAIAIRDAVPPSRTPFRPTPPTPPNEHCGVDGSCVPLGPRPPPQQPE